MPRRIAGVCALLTFAVCLIAGMQAHNTFSTTVARALVAMVVTFAVGLLLGVAAQKMLDDNLKAEESRLKNQSQEQGDGR